MVPTQPEPAKELRQRLFIAIAVPESVKKRLELAQTRLREAASSAAVRWVKPEQMHLTLRFLGSVPASDVTLLQNALEAACHDFPALALEAVGVGFFPRPQSPRVIWAGVRGDVEPLGRLQQSVERQVSSFSSEPGDERFHAHLTLGRVKGAQRHEAEQLRAAAQAMNAESFGKWTAPEVLLVRSQLSPKGSVYTNLFFVSLRV